MATKGIRRGCCNISSVIRTGTNRKHCCSQSALLVVICLALTECARQHNGFLPGCFGNLFNVINEQFSKWTHVICPMCSAQSRYLGMTWTGHHLPRFPHCHPRWQNAFESTFKLCQAVALNPHWKCSLCLMLKWRQIFNGGFNIVIFWWKNDNYLGHDFRTFMEGRNDLIKCWHFNPSAQCCFNNVFSTFKPCLVLNVESL